MKDDKELDEILDKILPNGTVIDKSTELENEQITAMLTWMKNVKVKEAKAAIQSLIDTRVREAQADILTWATGGIKEFTEDGKVYIPKKIAELKEGGSDGRTSN